MVEYLGLILLEGCIEMDPVKVAGVHDWPTQGMSPRSLHQLTKKGETWKWAKDEWKALERTQMAHHLNPHPHTARPDVQFWMEMDASGYATGAVLSQLGKDDPWHLVGFTSKSLSSAERNYEIHNKELLSIIRGLEEWRHILEGTKNTIEILNDHWNLTYFRESQNLNHRQACWSLFLSRFDFLLIHRPEQHSVKPDALPCQTDHLTEEKTTKIK